MARPPTPSGPRLPHEVQVSVLAFALLTVDPQSRNRVRLNLRLVCKRWNQSVYDWKQVEAVELKQLRGLVKAIEEDEDRKESVRSVYLELMETGGKGKVASGVRLFELVDRVARVELRVGFKAFGGREEEETLSKKVRKVMVKWQRLKHFQIGGKVGAKPPAVSLTTLKELSSHWPKLRTVTLDHCKLTNPDTIRSPLSTLSSLTSIHLILDPATLPPDLSKFLSALPSSLRHLHLSHPELYTNPAFAPALTRRLSPIAPNLSTLSLTDTSASDSAPHSLRPAPRTTFAQLVPLLSHVTRLELGPAAVPNLAALADLDELAELRLVHGRAYVFPPLGGEEVLRLLRKAAELRVLELEGRRLREDWAPAMRVAVANTAAKEGVRYVAEERGKSGAGRGVEQAIIGGGRALGWSRAGRA